MRDQRLRLKPRWRTVIVLAAVLLIASVVPSPLRRYPAFDQFGPDKLMHLVGHAGFAAVLADALATDRCDTWTAALLAVVASTGYAILTGTLQRWVPGRESEPADFAAGVIGSIFGALGWRRFERSTFSCPICGFGYD
jgi:VanZ family protein